MYVQFIISGGGAGQVGLLGPLWHPEVKGVCSYAISIYVVKHQYFRRRCWHF